MLSPSDKKVVQVLSVTLILNVVVCAAKLIYGIISHSLSLEADGFHSLMDSSSNIVGLTAVILASRPPDEGHPYGHRKIEALASMGISFLLFVTCYEMITGVMTRLDHPVEPTVTVISFSIMVATLLTNFISATYERRQGARLKSDLLMADALHTRSDMYVSLSVIASFVGVLLNFTLVDLFIASGIVLFIAHMSYQILSRSFNVLLDAQLINPSSIESIVKNIPGIALCHKIRSRGTANGIFVDLHIHVDPNLSTESSHALTHRVIDAIRGGFPSVIDVLIHTEPSHLSGIPNRNERRD